MMDFLVGMFGGIGRMVKVHTLVDYYSYVKAVEYLICVGFFCTFPIFYRYIMKDPENREDT